jgi:Rrf2 family iron-sulfur cluster assembly transcriptional regulator
MENFESGQDPVHANPFHFRVEHPMRLSTRGRFAITALIDLALREDRLPVPLVDLAMQYHISLSYLEQVFAKLRQAGIVESTRGPGGGYSLGVRGDHISVADIIAAIEDESPVAEAGDRGPSFDFTEDLWNNLHTALMEHMKSISLRSLALEQKAKGFKSIERKYTKKKVSPKPQTRPVHNNPPNSVFAWNGAWPHSK